MIRWCVGNVVKGFARNGDDVLGNCKVVHALDREWKLLLRPAEHHLSNLTPFWANGNFDANRSGVVSGGIYERDMNVAVRFHFTSTIRPVSAYHFCSDGILSDVFVNSTSGPSPPHA
jgi:hypothetical protein